MELINKMMDILMPPIAFISLFFFLPSFYLYKSIHYLLSSLFPENMDNKVVLITSASSGLGEHLAYEYAKKGAVLVLVARRVKSLQEVAMRCRDVGSPSVLVVPADVSKPEECQRFIEQAINNFGRLDHLVNNAGIESVGLVEEITDMTNFKVLMDVNFWGSVYPTYFAIPHLKASKGRVVVMSSMAGYTFVPRMAFYSASKGALISFYDTLRMEFGSEIAISIIAPGVIESEMTKGKIFTTKEKMEVDQESRDAMLGLVPVQPAKDFAKAVVSHVCTGAIVLSSSIPSGNSGLLAEATVLVVPSGAGHKISFETNVVLSHKEAFVCTVNTVARYQERVKGASEECVSRYVLMCLMVFV